MAKTSVMLVLLALTITACSADDPWICPGRQGQFGEECVEPCSNIVSARSSLQTNNGKFNTGFGNTGDGNDGHDNIGNFNIGANLVGNCIEEGNDHGDCDIGNDNGQTVLRFCRVFPADQKCHPGTYLAEYSEALRSEIPNVVAQCGVQSKSLRLAFKELAAPVQEP